MSFNMAPAVAPMVVNINEDIPFEELKGFHPAGSIRAVVVFDAIKDQYYRVSENTSLKETLVFRCDAQGTPTTYREVAGSREVTIEDVLKDWAEGNLYFFGEDDG